jgi:hypothetical protein
MRSGRATVIAWNPAHDTDYGHGDNEKLPGAHEICFQNLAAGLDDHRANESE